MSASHSTAPGGQNSGLRRGVCRLGGALLLLCIGLALSAPPAQGQVQLALLGDVMLGRGVAERFGAGAPNPLGWLTGDLQAADLALANLESPLTGRPLVNPDGYDLRARPEAAAWLADSGLDVLSLANNHSLDSGLPGLADTRAALSQYGLQGLAAGEAPLRFEIKGVKLAVLAYEGVTHPLDLATIEAAVRQEKAGGRVVIVSLHWGAEFRPAPEPSQREIARSLAEAGADLVWGQHPHVLQPVEWFARPGSEHPTLVIYSLGNALFDQQAPPDARWGALLLATLDSRGVSGLSVRPFKIDIRSGGLTPAEAALAAQIEARLQWPDHTGWPGSNH